MKIQCVYSYIGAVIKLRISAYEFFILTKSAYINISLNKSAYALLFQVKVRMMGNLIDMEIKGYEQFQNIQFWLVKHRENSLLLFKTFDFVALNLEIT